MPTYTFLNSETGEEEDHVLRISQLDEFKEANPHLSRVFTPSQLVSGVNQKPDAGFREVLKNIKRANRRSNINTFE